MRVLVTGANGFVGSGVLARLVADARYRPVAARRRSAVSPLRAADGVVLSDQSTAAELRDALRGVEAVVHAAGRAHVVDEAAVDPLAEYRRVNVGYTRSLARHAAEAGVRRFVFISSVKVNGGLTNPGESFRAGDPPAPDDDYALSKWEAEQELRDVAQRSGLETVIIRPVLVYGPGVKANFRSMLRWLQLGIPLPFGAVDNKRSLVALDNLSDLIVTCLNHPMAANRTLLVSDGEDLSTPALLTRAARALNTRARLIPVPPALLSAVARVAGRANEAARLLGSLQVDTTETRELLGWTPSTSVDEALRLTARHFLEDERRRRFTA